MKKFTFTLQTLYGLKQSLERQERNELGRLTARLNELEAGETALLARRAQAGQEFAARIAQGMTAADTTVHTSYQRALREQIAEQRAKIRQAREDVDGCRARLLEAMREVHMLEKLRERQYEQYLKDLQAEESAAINDFVSFTVAAGDATRHELGGGT